MTRPSEDKTLSAEVVTEKQFWDFCDKKFLHDYNREYIYVGEFLQQYFPNGLRIVPSKENP